MSNVGSAGQEYEFDWQNPNRKRFEFGRVFGRAFSGVFANIGPLLIALFIVMAASVVTSIISTSQLKEIIGSNDIDTAVSEPGYWIWSIGASVPAIFFTLWIQLIVVETAHADFTNAPQPASPLTSTLKYMLPMFVVALIYAFVAIIGFYAIFIGFLFVWPGWALAGPILVHEKKGIFGSIGYAWTLSKGSKRWILLLLFLLSIIGIIIYSIFAGIAVLAVGVNMLGDDIVATINMSIGQQIISTLIVGVGGYFIYAVFASGITAAYVETKTLKGQATDLGEIFS